MPDRDLPEDLKAKLAAELASGVSLSAPLASQARYATGVPAAGPQRHLRGRVLTLSAAALVVLVAATFAGPPQPRAWLVRTAGNIAGGLGAQVGTSSPTPDKPTPPQSSPRGGTDAKSPSPKAIEAPDGDETPGAQASAEPQESPEPAQSPEPAESPDSGGGDHSSPNASPSPDAGGSGDGN